ncbi:MAG: transcriptional regulator NrdR [Hydrogenothermaceae bacterium]|nr:transcriptional regulator NrdR [Hydrogenothermaceae bacterium]
MRCPKCGSLSDKVLETRQSKDGSVIKRRRECLECGYRFTTYERIEEENIKVIKKDGKVEPFNKEKIIRGIKLASKGRPISETQIVEIADSIERFLIDEGKLTTTSYEIGEMVKERLKQLDKVAYLRFLSVYEDFKDIRDFQEKIKEIEKE